MKLLVSLFTAIATVERMPGDNEVKAELDLGPPPPEVVEYAKREVNEDPETRCQIVSELRDMIYGEWNMKLNKKSFLLRTVFYFDFEFVTLCFFVINNDGWP